MMKLQKHFLFEFFFICGNIWFSYKVLLSFFLCQSAPNIRSEHDPAALLCLKQVLQEKKLFSHIKTN